MGETPSLIAEFEIGARIKINRAAGARLADKHGIVIGTGRYRNSIRISVDGAKTLMTLHKKYISIAEAS
jgi:hypothetical protein